MTTENQQNSDDININHQAELLEKAEPKPISIGEMLRKKREDLKMEVADISSRLRVKTSDIYSLESDQLDGITKHLYIPGLINSYAKILKIDQKLVEEKIKLLAIKSNVENKKHQLLNIGEGDSLSPNKDTILNFSLASILLMLVLLSLYYSYENKSDLIKNEDLIKQIEEVEPSNQVSDAP